MSTLSDDGGQTWSLLQVRADRVAQLASSWLEYNYFVVPVSWVCLIHLPLCCVSIYPSSSWLMRQLEFRPMYVALVWLFDHFELGGPEQIARNEQWEIRSADITFLHLPGESGVHMKENLQVRPAIKPAGRMINSNWVCEYSCNFYFHRFRGRNFQPGTSKKHWLSNEYSATVQCTWDADSNF